MDFDMKNITELTETNIEAEVLRAPGPVLVDFYAPWCGPCKMLAPLLEQFAADFAGKVKLAKVNIDEAVALAGEFGIRPRRTAQGQPDTRSGSGTSPA